MRLGVFGSWGCPVSLGCVQGRWCASPGVPVSLLICLLAALTSDPLDLLSRSQTFTGWQVPWVVPGLSIGTSSFLVVRDWDLASCVLGTVPHGAAFQPDSL